MYKSILFSLVALIFLFTSCEKELDIKLTQGTPSLVVEGNIESDNYPVVTLTKSVGFFEKIDFNSIQYAKGASVKVTDITSNQTLPLKEYNIDTLIDGVQYKFSLYSIDYLDPIALNFKGQFEHSYKLTINYEGKTYEGITKIPASQPLDSIRAIDVVGKADSFSQIKAFFNDPDTLGNYAKYKTLTKHYNKDNSNAIYLSPFNDIFDDKLYNGINVPVTIDLGVDRNDPNLDFNTAGFMRHGDTTTIKWMAIDNQVYDFWNTLAFAKGSVGNPFSSPIKVKSNMNNGALGCWAGYGVLYFTIIDSL
jgi:hypothetical protein